MSEENINKNEETAALFVSSQKKKVAEEAARKKAEEEQARRDAEEAEVRRIEQEVADRKRELEEQKKAVEEAAQEAAQQAKQQEINRKITGAKTTAKRYGKFVVIGAVLVVVLCVVIGILVAKSRPKIDYSDLVFDEEYTSGENGFDVAIKYPGNLYSEVTEEMEGDILSIEFQPSGKKIPAMIVKLTALDVSLPQLQLLPGSNASMINSVYEDFRDQGFLSDEKLCDLSDSGTKYYEYSCNGIIADGKDEYAMASHVWTELNGDGKVVLVNVKVLGLADKENEVTDLRDAVHDENASDAIKVAGNYPLNDVNYDGYIEFAELGIKMPVPADRFKPLDDEKTIWGDDNGAYIMIDCNDKLDVEGLVSGDVRLSDTIDYFSEQAKGGLMDFDRIVINADSRTFVNEQYAYSTDYAMFADFDDDSFGFKYWERDYLTPVFSPDRDLAANLCVVTIVPESSRAQYESVLESCIEKICFMD
ncbi:MAG: hypothetical protein K5888_03740 [Lachnospiraceae bacterium]|nr:hypothetical protein [Lachnospiraceae bacterium]